MAQGEGQVEAVGVQQADEGPGGRPVPKWRTGHIRENGITGKLNGVGSVDDRPSTNKLHHFVTFIEEKKLRQ